MIPASILYKSIARRYRPVRVADGPITARYRFIKNASWDKSQETVIFVKDFDSKTSFESQRKPPLFKITW